MAIGVYFRPSDFTVERYDEAVAKLEAAGVGAPAGRLHHTALERGGLIEVFDVWESQESLDAFGASLVPILAELGVDPGRPEVSPVHNIVVG